MASEQSDSNPDETAAKPDLNTEEDGEKPTLPADEIEELGPDEVYSTSCGAPIKRRAEVCPKCGVRQKTDQRQSGPIEMSDRRQYELEKIASQDITMTMVWGFLLSPVGYLKVRTTGLAVLNFLTFNYLFLGFIIVPFHTRKMIKGAREELRRAGIAGY